jgi:predicted DNA-binding transcriptional regulator AlpA
MAREPYATPEQVAAFYGIAIGTLYNWRSAGRGPRARKIGGQLRFDWRDVEAYATAPRVAA